MSSFLSESLTVALFLVVLFGTVCFYLYSRMSYTEKRLSLIENMLLDIKMSMDSAGRDEPEYVPEPVSAPSPLAATEGEALPSEGAAEESLYKNILGELHGETLEEVESKQQEVEQRSSTPVREESTRPPSPQLPTFTASRVMPNYEAMIKSELIALCEKRQLKVSGAKKRADLIAALRKYDEQQQSKSGSEITGNPHTGDLFPLSASVGDSGEGFSVDLGNAETLE